ncbi:MAG TPA: hypothetical protein VFJ05_01525 [Nitrososphaeraceae archaeon]|nr:hypothetical protein [Nitrososphaeraceae archaeon]
MEKQNIAGNENEIQKSRQRHFCQYSYQKIKGKVLTIGYPPPVII